MLNQFKGDRANLGNWARQLLSEKGHGIGEATCLDGVIKTDIDNIPKTPGEVVSLAAQYPEWRDREREHLEYLRKLQARF